MSITRNVVHGVIGFLVPTMVVAASYPVLVHRLGAAAFGVYLLALSLSGTVMLLDLGFCAATLKFVAEDLAAGRTKAAADVIVTSLAAYAVLGVVGGASVALAAPSLAGLFQMDVRMAAVAVPTFRLAALQFTAFLPAMVFVSVAKAFGQFDRSALYASLLSIATYGGAVVAVLAGAGLVGAMAATALANFAAVFAIGTGGVHLCQARGIRLSRGRPAAFRRMLGFGWVLTVNSVAGFLLYQIQRYVAGVALGPVAVTVIQTAAVVPSKMHAAVNAATEVMFPFSSASRDRTRLRQVYLRMLGGSAIVALAGFAALAALARPLLVLWLGAPLAASVSPLLPIFALGYFFLALSPAPFHLVNGIGRPGLNTVFYMMNALLNIAFLMGAAASGMTLHKLAWSFAAANILTGACYQIAVELLIWRREPRAAEVAA
ncbi:MAG: oligosaccharide flippase family protein [Acidobacteriia bacterium]|nr:oligosaccharide flippase family protein [Terriglobia bacterium]